MIMTRSERIFEIKHWIDGENTYKNEPISKFLTQLTVQTATRHCLVEGTNIEASIIRYEDEVKLIWWQRCDEVGIELDFYKAFDTAESGADIEILESQCFELQYFPFLAEADPYTRRAINNPVDKSHSPAQQRRETITQ